MLCVSREQNNSNVNCKYVICVRFTGIALCERWQYVCLTRLLTHVHPELHVLVCLIAGYRAQLYSRLESRRLKTMTKQFQLCEGLGSSDEENKDINGVSTNLRMSSSLSTTSAVS